MRYLASSHSKIMSFLFKLGHTKLIYFIVCAFFLINAPPKGIANELARVANDLYTFSDGVVYILTSTYVGSLQTWHFLFFAWFQRQLQLKLRINVLQSTGPHVAVLIHYHPSSQQNCCLFLKYQQAIREWREVVLWIHHFLAPCKIM